jgi:hypothetical protein
MGRKASDRSLVTHRLLQYLSIYESKKFEMHNVIIGIKDQLLRTGSISKGQFDVLLPFLKRERQFAGMDNVQLRNFFDSVIGKRTKKEVSYGASILEF